MGKGDSNINYPAQPSYGEGMADALKAQVELLTGTGDFASTGSLESLLPLEESIRKKTAQADTDILRQTLLGSEQKVVKDPETGKYGIPGAEPVTNNQGQVQSAGGGRYQIITTSTGVDGAENKNGRVQNGTSPSYAILDTDTGGITESSGGIGWGVGLSLHGSPKTAALAAEQAMKDISEKFKNLQTTIDKADGNTDAVAQTFSFTNPNTGLPLQEGEVVRAEDGMVDLIGDKRGVQNTVAKEVTKIATQADVDAGKASKVGDSFTNTVYEQVDANREAGFDESGNFLGLSAFGEDIQAGNLSRQRERDLKDVARLSGTYQDIMDDYRPGTQEALESARAVLEGQKDSLTGAGAIDIPTGSTYGEDVTSKGFDAATNDTAVSLTGDTSYTADEAATTELGLHRCSSK